MRTKWSSYIGFILSVAGAAIGLGNVWRFPYIIGIYGGGNFLLAYCGCLLLIGLPLMYAEINLGRVFNSCPVKTMANTTGKLSGWLMVCISFLILSFYTVISGCALAFFVYSLLDLPIDFATLTSNFNELFIWSIIFLCLSGIIVAKGIQQGLEKANIIFLPILYLSLIALIISTANLPGFNQSLKFVFAFNSTYSFSSLVLEALGQSLFSLAVGAGCLIAYGAYIPKKHKISTNILPVLAMTILVGIMASIAIFSVCFSYDIPVTSGPSLMFVALQIAFKQMQYGHLVASLFYGVLVLAALTSAISFVEVIVTSCMTQFNFKRTNATMLCVVGVCAPIILCIGSFNFLSHIQVFGANIFNFLVNTLTNKLLPLTALCIAISYGFHTKKNILTKGLFTSKTSAKFLSNYIRYVVASAIVLYFGISWFST